MIAPEQTLAVLNAEMPGAQAWAARRGYPFAWDPDSQTLQVVLCRMKDQENFFLRGGIDNYPILPPSWTLTAPDGSAAGTRSVFPGPIGNGPCGGWIFIAGGNGGVICAPFNRLAYSDHGGPHGDWGGPAHWRSAGVGYVQAQDIGSMLAAIDRDLQYTTGRMT